MGLWFFVETIYFHVFYMLNINVSIHGEFMKRLVFYKVVHVGIG